ncbi:GNAT family N-acetyltransferase [Pseudobutyrivibrio xylanivorans]|uniref:Putative acetyltransferase n=1 Tax=Pseudobutyrivibrio xylanivorans TaxID=185007 RepID=A0A1G5S4M1_PSEXY|nr:GNAT family N-acetyltransferase [Pseudobutyrivibrio xylanivorans]SCZ81315.1 putative acetyltransferase [Pseudobutyrivibrio xylanivorans]
MNYRIIEEKDNSILAKILRDNLKAHNLDIPGTVYFDEAVNHLSDYYLANPEKRTYYVILDESNTVIGGIGLDELAFMSDTAELQKLYLTDKAKGSGLSYKLMDLIENTARDMGYKQMYLETHDNLAAAIHVYEKCGYKEIDRPEAVVHSSMNRFYLKEL